MNASDPEDSLSALPSSTASESAQKSGQSLGAAEPNPKTPAIGTNQTSKDLPRKPRKRKTDLEITIAPGGLGNTSDIALEPPHL